MSRTLCLDEIWDLAYRYVPATAADRRLDKSGPRSWWPAHEIGHFLVATAAECRAPLFGIDTDAAPETSEYRYMTAKEIAATSISQRLLRRSGHKVLADEEIFYTDEETLACSFESWCKRAAGRLLRVNKAVRLPTTYQGLEALLARKAREADTPAYPSRQAAQRARPPLESIY